MAFVTLEKQGHVGIMTIDRQEALNALNSQVLTDLSAAIDQAENDGEIYVVVLTGAGRSFVAGADIGEMKEFSSIDGKKFGVHGGEVFLKLENMSKPVIAAINGFALGGGCELSMACDIRLASEKAKFGQPEVGLGITPGFGGTQRLARLVGMGMAKQMLYTARNIDANEALRIGLVNAVYPQADLMEAAVKMANTIARNALIAVRGCKKAVNEGMQVSIDKGVEIEEKIFGGCFETHDQVEGMACFLSREKPKPKAVFTNN